MPEPICQPGFADHLALLLAMAANVATVFGIPIALLVWWRDRKAARESRENNTYQTLQQQYQDFLRLCFDNSHLGMATYDRQVARELTEDEQAQRITAYEILVSMLEHAYFMYSRDHEKDFQQRQWTGWNQYMEYWAARARFREIWKNYLRHGFDTNFVAHMDGLIAGSKEEDA